MRIPSPRLGVVAVVLAAGACSSATSGLFPYLEPARGGSSGTTFAALDRALVTTIDRSQERAERAPAPPIALTTSDGAGLQLARLELDAVVDGPVALTELRLIFHNPEPRVREGRFAITLPPDAALSRFAMKNEEWREAEVVARQRAREVYETFLKRQVDPALLEKGAGNTFTARVFPIPASGDKELILGYSQEVSAATPYQVPLAGLPAVGELRWSITVDGQTRRGVERGRAPRDLAAEGAHDERALIAGEAFVARVVPPVTAAAEPLGAALVLVDTSGSAASIIRRQAEAARAVVTAIAVRDPSAPVEVRAFDQTVEPLIEGPAGTIDVDRLVEAIVARGGLGASDLGRALASAAGGGERRVIVISDGVATVGERAAGALAARVRAAGVTRLDAITVGGAQDRDVLLALTAAGARGGAIIDGDRPEALAALEQAMLGAVAISVDGARDVWPTSLRSLAAGQPVVIYGHRRGDPRQPLSIRFTAGGETRAVTIAATPGPAPLVERAVARADVTRLTAELGAAPAARRAELRTAIERLGLAHRLVTGETSLLVLETDDDYARFCIDRRGLTGLLTVSGGAIRVIDRGGGAARPSCESPAAPASPAVSALATSATTGAVAGVISERGSGEPVVGATVVIAIEGRTETAITDEHGWYGLGGLPAGAATLHVYYSDTQVERRIAIEAGRVIDLGGAGRGPALARAGEPPADETPPVGSPPPGATGSASVRGATIDREHTRNVPVPARSFEATVGTAAGSQGDRVGVTFSGSSSVENTYGVDGVNATGISIDTAASGGETILINSTAPAIDVTSTTQGVTIYGSVGMPGLTAPVGDHPPPTDFSGNSTDDAPPPPPPPPPYEGRLLTVMEHLRAGRQGPALRTALAWYLAEPTDLAAIVALGEALEARGAVGLAARAYGTILDRFPERVELVRYAGERLDRLGPAGRAPALDAYRQAVADRPDHATGYRLLAMAQVRTGDLDGALTTLERGLGRATSDGIRAIFRGDLGLVGAALAARAPARRAELVARLQRRGATLAEAPSVRFVLHWETDTNDVDLHVRDRHGGHAYYSQKQLPSGGALLEDVTTGYGPEEFLLPGRPVAAPYRLSTHYYSRGAMGLGLGTVQIVSHDGRGGLAIDARPFVLQVDGAEVDLGSYAP